LRTTAILILLLISIQSWGQFFFKGTTNCSKDKTPIPYLNIGIVNKNIGTVSDINGHFYLKIPEKYYNDSIRFSSISYQSKTLLISEIIKGIDTTIYFEPLAHNLTEVKITPKKYKTKTIGCKSEWPMSGNYGVDQLGHELGIKIEVKGKTTRIKDFNFGIAANHCDTLVFRLNIYKLIDTVPHENILKENIIVKTAVKSGIVTVDLEKYNIVLDHDFLITLEWLVDYEKSCIDLRIAPQFLSSTTIFIKNTSQGTWTILRNWGVEFFVTVEQ
jgi:hypothetical protein